MLAPAHHNRSRVLVTRAASSASRLAEALAVLGLDPVSLPAISTTEPTSTYVLDDALTRLAEFHWLLFTSATAVEAFAQRYGGRSLPTHLRIAAIGPATSRALEVLGRSADLVPSQAVAESFYEALLPHALQADGTATRFLLPRAEEARDYLRQALQAAGADLTIAPAYRTVIPPESVRLAGTLFSPDVSASQAVAAITFTSASTARNLLSLCDAAGVTLPSHALRISIGPITSETLRDLGLPPHAESPEASIPTLARTVFETLQTYRS